MNWILTIVVAIGVFVVGSRDTQKDQSFAIQKVEAGQQRLEDTFRQRVEARDKQIESLKQSILTKEVFDVYQKNWTERENRQDELLNKILENQHK